MVIRVKLTRQEFINANLVLLYSKTTTKVFTGIILFFVLVSNVAGMSLQAGTFKPLIYPLLLLAFPPVSTYFSSKKAFDTNKTIGETIDYECTNEQLITKGETFSTEVTWSHIYKVTQTTNWILIWRNSQMANAVPKKIIWDEQRAELKEILTKNKVKNNL